MLTLKSVTLTKLLPLIFFLLLGFNAFTQSDSSKKVDVNFLFNYYDQEGDHSAVTGGKGTQELQDVAGKIVMKVNLDSASTLFTGLSLNRYSSASTDRIDSRLSSASAIDYHLEVNVGYEKRINDKLTKGGNFYSAVESDYISMGLGYSLKRKKVKNGTYGLKINGFYDSWIIIYPEELRRANFRMVHTDKRYSLNLSQSYTWNMSRRMKASFNLDLTWQSGLLSTPFHRVYFSDTAAVSVEQLPGNRIKIPVGFQWNYFATDYLILRTKARLYQDNFGINALTVEASPVFLVNNYLSIAPFYRYHTQSESKYFNSFAQNRFNDDYYTSDYDLSGFRSTKYGVEVKYNPLYGVLGKNRLGMKNIGFRYSRFSRSDGLEAHIFGLNCGFVW